MIPHDYYNKEYWDHKPRTKHQAQQLVYSEALLGYYKQFFNAESSVLEVGCGQGDMLKRVRATCPGACGIDISDEALGKCPPPVHCCPAESTPFPAQSMDFVYSHHVIEHLSEPQRFFLELARILKSQGVAVLITGPCMPEIVRRIYSPREFSHVSPLSKPAWRRLLRERFQIVDELDSILKLDPPNMRVIKTIYENRMLRPLALLMITQLRAGFVVRQLS